MSLVGPGPSAGQDPAVAVPSTGWLVGIEVVRRQRLDVVRASVDAETDMQRPEDFENIVVRQEDDLRVRLADVADLETTGVLRIKIGRIIIYHFGYKFSIYIK